MVASTTETPLTVRVPTEADFDEQDFLDDELLERLFWDVVKSYPRLSVIPEHDIEVRVLWKKRGGKSGGGLKLAKCQKTTSGLLGHYAQSQFTIWIAADHVAANEWTTPQIRKLLYHEGRHIGWSDPREDDEDAEGTPVIVGHDLELFRGEVEDTGAWEWFRKRLATEFLQSRMDFDASGEGAEEVEVGV